MPHFRKKPVVIEARQFDGSWSCAKKLIAWMDSDEGDWSASGPTLIIRTLEGDHHALVNDWIICGVAGEFYPCKPDIFLAIYEPA